MPFQLAVFLKAGMFAGADVVRVQVGEHAHFIMDARHAVHHEALTGHFHQRRIAAGVQKLPESLLQLVALRGGVGRLLMVAEEVDAVGADHAHFAACGFQHALYHVGGGGLALGTGDTDHGHPAGGVAEQVAAHECQRIAAALHLQHGSTGDGGKVDVVLDHQRRHGRRATHWAASVAVPLGTHDADESRPGAAFRLS